MDPVKDRVAKDSALVGQRRPEPEIKVPEFPRWSRDSRLLVHDWFVTWAGAERVLEQLLMLFPDADVVVGVLRKDLPSNEVTERAGETWLPGFPGARRSHRWFLPLEVSAFMSPDTSPYDLVVSSIHAFAKAVRGRKPGTVYVCDCHAPPRYLWDLTTATGGTPTCLRDWRYRRRGFCYARSTFGPLLKWTTLSATPLRG